VLILGGLIFVYYLRGWVVFCIICFVADLLVVVIVLCDFTGWFGGACVV